MQADRMIYLLNSRRTLCYGGQTIVAVIKTKLLGINQGKQGLEISGLCLVY